MLGLWFCVMSECGFVGDSTHWKIQDCWKKGVEVCRVFLYQLNVIQT